MVGLIVYGIVGFIEVLVGLRFILRLLGANPDSGFVQGVYEWSTPFVTPFAGIFGQEATVTGSGVVTTSVFDWTALIALVVYAIIAGVIGMAFSRSRR